MNDLILRIRLLLFAFLHLHSRPVPPILLRRFSNKDIKKATDGFCRIVLNSSHGAAYKAKFNSGRLALVKEIRDYGQQDDDFYRQVQLLGCLHHRHIVALIGFSMGRKRFLVFENLENGSLKEHLNDPLKTPLNWRTRLSIAIGVAAALGTPQPPSNRAVKKKMLERLTMPPTHHTNLSRDGLFNSTSNASCLFYRCDMRDLANALACRDLDFHVKVGNEKAQGMEYLHFFCDPPVYHVSISSSNIMLDENFNAKVGLLGFGITHSTFPQPSGSTESKGHVSGNIMHQLGLLILELITGQSSDEGGVDLIKWVNDSRLQISLDNMIDPDLGNNYNSAEVKGLLAVARLCVKSVDKPNSFTPQIFRYLQKKVAINRSCLNN